MTNMAKKGLASAVFLTAFALLSTGVVWATDNTAFYPEGDQGLQVQEAEYPDSFDLRNVDGKSYTTPVRLQNPFGTCWGFGATAAAESSILADPELNEGLDAATLDLSEKHLSWFAMEAVNDPANSQNGEGVHFYEDGNDANVHYDTGGFAAFATAAYASGVGPAAEEAFPYRGARGETVRMRVATAHDKDGTPKNYQYKDIWNNSDDDWTLPEEDRFQSEYDLQETFILPPPAKLTTGKDGGTHYEYSQEGVDAIKEQLCRNHRAVAISFCAESYAPGQDTSGKEYMSDKWAHYTWNENDGSNHVVAVVGYDDNYPRENFLEGHQPPANGAFLIKNSWGSEMNAFPNNGYRHWGLLEGQDGIPYDKDAEAVSDKATGYFWISYYDRSIGTSETYDFTRDDDARVEQQHDFIISGDVYKAEDAGTRMANVFTAKSTSKLSAFSVMTTTPDTEVSYEIYLLRGGCDDPTEGLKIAEGTERFQYGGYHRISLKPYDQVTISKGQDYSVIVSEKAGGKEYFTIMSGSKEGSVLAGMYRMYQKAVVNKGESFFYAGGKWKDLSVASDQESILKKTPDYMKGQLCMDNFPIKTFLDPVNVEGATFRGYLRISNWAEGCPGTFQLSAKDGDNSMTLMAEIAGLREADPDVHLDDIKWTSSDESVFTVQPKANDPGQAIITGKGARGDLAYLTVDAGIYGKRIVGVQIRKPHVRGLDFPKLNDACETPYTGKAVKPQTSAYAMDEEVMEPIKEGVDYTVTFSNNVKCGIATATATAVPGGKWTGTDSEDFIIVPARGKITKIKKSGNKLTVKWKSQKASGLTGYQLSYRAKGASKWTSTKLGADETSLTLKGLKKGKPVQVRIRGYVEVWDELHYGQWSKTRNSGK